MNLVLPSPQTITPAQVASYGAQVEAAARQTDDVNEVVDLTARWSAIAEYVRRTSTEGIAQAEATKRRLEIRIGELAPPRPPGNPNLTGVGRIDEPLSHNRMSEARKMAANPTIVAEVIDRSTDVDPPTKAKVLAAIRDAAQADIETQAAEAVERWPELADPDAGIGTSAAALAMAGQTLARDPWRIDGLHRRIAAKRKEREGCTSPQPAPIVERACPHCSHIDRHICEGGQR